MATISAVESALIVWAMLHSHRIPETESDEVNREDNGFDENDAPKYVSPGNLIAHIFAFTRALIENSVCGIMLPSNIDRPSAAPQHERNTQRDNHCDQLFHHALLRYEVCSAVKLQEACQYVNRQRKAAVLGEQQRLGIIIARGRS